MHRTLLGVLIITLLDNGLKLMGVGEYVQMVVKGAVVISAVLVSQDRTKLSIAKYTARGVGAHPQASRSVREKPGSI